MLHLYCWVMSEQHGGLHLKETQTVIIRPQNQQRERVAVLKTQKMTVYRDIYATIPSAEEVDDQG